MLHCDLRLRWKIASDLRFQAAISEPETLLSAGFLAIWVRQREKLLAIAIVRFACAKAMLRDTTSKGGGNLARPPPRGPPCMFRCSKGE